MTTSKSSSEGDDSAVDIAEAVLRPLLAPYGPDGPGVAICMTGSTAATAACCAGLANVEHASPITPSTVFHIASVSKQFTAMAIALLVREGLVRLDAPVVEYLDWIPDFGATLTVRHLVHHTSGLRDQWQLLVLGGWRMEDVKYGTTALLRLGGDAFVTGGPTLDDPLPFRVVFQRRADGTVPGFRLAGRAPDVFSS